MGLVYWIHCNETNQNYIGSTTYSLNKRINEHIKESYKYSSKPIIDRNNYSVSILEDNINKDILKVREQFYMDCCDNLLNIYRANGVDEVKKKKTLAKAYHNYWINHKEEINKKKGIKITCECGSVYRKSGKSQHIKTKKHLDFVAS